MPVSFFALRKEYIMAGNAVAELDVPINYCPMCGRNLRKQQLLQKKIARFGKENGCEHHYN